MVDAGEIWSRTSPPRPGTSSWPAASKDNLNESPPRDPPLSATPTLPLDPDGVSSRPRTPSSISHSAVKDGRSLLATFRQNKRRNYSSTPASATAGVRARQIIRSSGGAASAEGNKYSPEERTKGYVEMYKSRAPDLARSLEAALDASLANRRNAAVATSDDVDDDVDVDGGHGDGGSQRNSGDSGDSGGSKGTNGGGGQASYNKHHHGNGGCGPNDDAVGSSGAKSESDSNNSSSSDGSAASVAAAAAAAAAAATAAAAADAAVEVTAPSANGHGGGSPTRPTPEMLRQDARASQADFLSSVLPAREFDFGTAVPSNGHSSTTPTSTSTILQGLSPPRPPNGPAMDDAVVASELSGDRAQGPEANPAATTNVAASLTDATAVRSSFSDKQAVARWTSMRRLQEQSVGLGIAADHQLTRALQLCRDLRGMKTGAGGGFVSGHERAPRLDALQSTLHGLQEVLSKRSLVDKAASVEAEALGGPAVLTSLLSGNGHHTQAAAAAAAAASGRREATAKNDISGGGGWLSGSQLKAFEEQVHVRSSMEISALESERRKLRSKVEMFQRQVQLLQREGASHSPAAAAGGVSRIGNLAAAMGEGDGGVSVSGSAAGEKRFADLLDARLGEERHVQATLEAELASVRGNLEEKDGLISALREALGSAATPKANGDGDANANAAVVVSARQHDDAIASHAPAPLSASPGSGAAVVPGRGVFAPLSNESNRSRGRYHSRSSRLLGAQGPVAAAEAAAAIASSRGNGSRNPFSQSRSRFAREEEKPRRAEGAARRGAPNGGEKDNSHSDVVSFRHSSSADAVVVDPAAGAFSHGYGGGVGGAAASSGRAGQNREARGEGNAFYGDGHLDMLAQASVATGSALKGLWDSARVRWLGVGLNGGDAEGAESPTKSTSRRGDNSSHAVLIL